MIFKNGKNCKQNNTYTNTCLFILNFSLFMFKWMNPENIGIKK